MSDGHIEQIGTPVRDLQLPGDGVRGVVRRHAQPGQRPGSSTPDRRSPVGRRPGDPEPARPSTNASDDGRVTLALRPEGIALGEGDPGANRLHGTVEDINFLGSIVRIRVRLGEGEGGEPPSIVALDTFNEPHLQGARRGPAGDDLVPARGVVRARRGARRGGDPELRRSARRCDRPARRHRARHLRQGRHAHRVRPDVERLGRDARRSPRGGHRAGRSRPRSTRCSATTPARGTVLPGGGLAATPMARLRERTGAVLATRAWTARPRSERSTRPGTRRTRSSWPGP